MNGQSVFFLQALWDLGIEKDKIVALSKENIKYEIERSMKGVLHPETLWISDDAKKLKQELISVKMQVDRIDNPYQLAEIVDQYKKIMNEIQAMQIQTVQTLNSDLGPLVPDMHILVRQLFPMALARIKEQIKYELYRLFILSGRLDFEGIALPDDDSLQDWIKYYRDIVYALINKFNSTVLDGRWAYEKRKVVIHKKISFIQFIAVTPREEEIAIAPGKADFGIGDEGGLRIYGRGYITNLAPEDMPHSIGAFFIKRLMGSNDFSKIRDENENPAEILDHYFGDQKYMVSAEEYFRFINVFLIAKEFYPRIKRGNCIYCGSPLHQGICLKCEGQ